ncbi:MAG: arylsulfatase [Verrucomicrobia bacterium]|nr:arylsulfatase [Verrucomicrobiota bacterium]
MKRPLALTVLLAGFIVSPAFGAIKPNIVYVLADDLGLAHVGCFNPEAKLPTPSMDKLATEGMRFTDAHSASVCTPTRYAILTGRYGFRSRSGNGVLAPYDSPLIEYDRLTVPALLQRQGYYTACIGKWHLGWEWPAKDGSKPDPLAQKPLAKWPYKDNGTEAGIDFTKPITGGPLTRGFDEYFGTDAPNQPPFCFIRNDRLTTELTGRFPGHDPEIGVTIAGPMAAGWKFENIAPVLSAEVDKFLQTRAADRKPFFLYYPLTIPHQPFTPSTNFFGKSGIHRMADLILETDAMLGAVLDTLDRTGLRSNTIVIFTSDNGQNPRIKSQEKLNGGFAAGRPFRGAKGSLLEGGHRMPFVVRWPGEVKPGSVCNEVISLASLMATCADLLDVKLPAGAGEDSASILPLLRGKPEAYHPSQGAVVNASGIGFAIRQGPWKLVETRAKPQPNGEEDGGHANAISGLYNLASDPGERTNVAASTRTNWKRVLPRRRIRRGRKPGGIG